MGVPVMEDNVASRFRPLTKRYEADRHSPALIAKAILRLNEASRTKSLAAVSVQDRKFERVSEASS